MPEEATYIIEVRVKARGEDELPSPAELAFGIADGLNRDWFEDTYPNAGYWIDRTSLKARRDE